MRKGTWGDVGSVWADRIPGASIGTWAIYTVSNGITRRGGPLMDGGWMAQTGMIR